MYLLQTQGTDSTETREFDTAEQAYNVMEKEFNSYDIDAYHLAELETFGAVLGSCVSEFYQTWTIVKAEEHTGIHQIIYDIRDAIASAYIGTTQYAYELCDTDVITEYLGRIESLVNTLESMIKD